MYLYVTCMGTWQVGTTHETIKTKEMKQKKEENQSIKYHLISNDEDNFTLLLH